MIPVLSLFNPADDPTGMLNTLGPIVIGFLLPLVVARLTSERAEKLVKFGVSAGLSLVVAGATAYGMDWTDPAAIPLLLERAVKIIGAAQIAYMAVDKVLESTTGTDLNSQPVVKPERGVG